MSDDIKPGWDGPEIPLEVQTHVMVRYFEHSLRFILQNVAFLHKDVMSAIGDGDAAHKIDVLSENPTFLHMMERFQGELGFEKYGDKAFRLNIEEIAIEARDELLDQIVYCCILLWIHDGAEFPEGLMEEYAKDSDEEE